MRACQHGGPWHGPLHPSCGCGVTLMELPLPSSSPQPPTLHKPTPHLPPLHPDLPIPSQLLTPVPHPPWGPLTSSAVSRSFSACSAADASRMRTSDPSATPTSTATSTLATATPTSVPVRHTGSQVPRWSWGAGRGGGGEGGCCVYVFERWEEVQSEG